MQKFHVLNIRLLTLYVKMQILGKNSCAALRCVALLRYCAIALVRRCAVALLRCCVIALLCYCVIVLCLVVFVKRALC